MSQDTISIAGLSVQMQDFAEVTDASGDLLVHRKADGVLGLGFHKQAVNLAVSPFYNMISQGLLSEPIIAFYFGHASHGGDESEITLGGINDDHFSGDLVELSLHRNNTWESELNSIAFRDWNTELNGTGAGFDTGAFMIDLPSAISDLMYVLSNSSSARRETYTFQKRKDGCRKRRQRDLFHRMQRT